MSKSVYLKNCFENLGLYYCFENLATDLKKLCRRVSLANCHSIIFWIVICLFPDIHLFLINCYFFQFLNYMSLPVFDLFLPVSASFLIVSTSFYSFTCLCVDQLFTSRFYLFLLIYQSFHILLFRLFYQWNRILLRKFKMFTIYPFEQNKNTQNMYIFSIDVSNYESEISTSDSSEEPTKKIFQRKLFNETPKRFFKPRGAVLCLQFDLFSALLSTLLFVSLFYAYNCKLFVSPHEI